MQYIYIIFSTPRVWYIYIYICIYTLIYTSVDKNTYYGIVYCCWYVLVTRFCILIILTTIGQTWPRNRGLFALDVREAEASFPADKVSGKPVETKRFHFHYLQLQELVLNKISDTWTAELLWSKQAEKKNDLYTHTPGVAVDTGLRMLRTSITRWKIWSWTAWTPFWTFLVWEQMSQCKPMAQRLFKFMEEKKCNETWDVETYRPVLSYVLFCRCGCKKRLFNVSICVSCPFFAAAPKNGFPGLTWHS